MISEVIIIEISVARGSMATVVFLPVFAVLMDVVVNGRMTLLVFAGQLQLRDLR